MDCAATSSPLILPTHHLIGSAARVAIVREGALESDALLRFQAALNDDALVGVHFKLTLAIVHAARIART